MCLLASAACALAPNVETLTIARLLQGVGGAAGVVLARAIGSDVSKGAGAVKLLNVLAIIVVIAPVVGPLAGGGIIAASGWRAVFWVQVALVVIMTVGSVIWDKESLPADQRSTGGIRETLHNSGQALRNRQYVGYLLTFCLAFAGLFSYISASPFVIQNILGMSEGTLSVIFAINAVAITATSAVSAALAGRAPLRKVVGIGLGLAVLFGFGILVTVLAGLPMIPTLILLFCFQGSLGFIFGNATALALREAGHFAGTGSAFLGFLQFILAAAVAPLVGIAGEESAVPMGVAMVTFAVLAALAFFALTRRGADDE